ncbi:chemotaxis-specific protein-glutamate methyltransferase CheB, partial [Candidatus Poribacteria bacterium]|nr:chemotaxis-specific protein-glutamate methyltransferase CheB [Candidatus Poribacteria bacterium]
IVDDSPLVCQLLKDILTSDPQIVVAGVAHNGKEAVEMVPLFQPDIITMDINMPVMDGLEATRYIMAHNPTPILIVSSSVIQHSINKAFKAISYGALDTFSKSQLNLNDEKEIGKKLIEKIKVLRNVKVVNHPLTKMENRLILEAGEISPKRDINKIVAIVSSTGGPPALMEIFKNIPRNVSCSFVIVQHISDGFEAGLAEWLGNECKIEVKIAEDMEKIKNGVAYIAPYGKQMRVGNSRIHLSEGSSDYEFNPSGDILLESVAREYMDEAVGVILTGMGRDGAKGIKTIKESGGFTIAQNEKSSMIFGMPKAAIELNVVDKISPLENIANEIISALKNR